MAPKTCPQMLHVWHITCRQLTIPPNLNPSIASHPRRLCGQPQHGEQLAGRQGRRLQRSCQPLPRHSSTATAHCKHQKTMGFPGLISMSSSRSTSLPAPHQHSFLWAVSGKIQDRRRTSCPRLGHDGGMQKEGILLCAIAL